MLKQLITYVLCMFNAKVLWEAATGDMEPSWASFKTISGPVQGWNPKRFGQALQMPTAPFQTRVTRCHKFASCVAGSEVLFLHVFQDAFFRALRR